MAKPSLKDPAYRGLAATLGGPVDLSAMVLRPSGGNLYMTPIDQANFRAFKPIGDGRQNQGGGIFSRIDDKLSNSLIYQSIKDSVTAPGRAYRGELDPFSPAGTEEAVNAAFNVGSGGIATTAVRPVPGRSVLGMFVGRKSQTWDALAASRAKELESAGVDPRTIWKETGTWKGPDGKWRQEIPDNEATGTFTHLQEKGTDRLADRAVNHPLVYQAYPTLNDVTQLGLRDATPRGSYEHMGGTGGMLIAKAADEQGLASVGIHELSHPIQQIEGFARGGSPNAMTRDFAVGQTVLQAEKITKSPEYLARYSELVSSGKSRASARIIADSEFGVDKILGREITDMDAYRRLAGEAEARATQARMNMTPEQRRATFPEDSYDVPMSELIIQGQEGGGKAMAINPAEFGDGPARMAVADPDYNLLNQAKVGLLDVYPIPERFVGPVRPGDTWGGHPARAYMERVLAEHAAQAERMAAAYKANAQAQYVAGKGRNFQVQQDIQPYINDRPRNALGQEIPSTQKELFSQVDEWYHGSPWDIYKTKEGWFRPTEGEAGVPVVWGTKNLLSAEGYTRGESSFIPDEFGKMPLNKSWYKDYDDNGGIYTLESRAKNPFEYDAGGKDWFMVPQGKVIREAKAAGHDAVIFKNIKDNIQSGGIADDVIAWLDPNAIYNVGKPVRPRNALGQIIPPTQYELAHAEAQRVAALPVEQGGLGLPANNTAMDRARAMGVDTDGFHATGADIRYIDPSKVGASDYGTIGQGFYIDPSDTAGYANLVARINQGKFPQNIMPVKFRTDNLYDLTGTLGPDSVEGSKRLTQNMKDAGFDGTFTLMPDGTKKEVAVFNPSIVRSRFAAFNPAKRYESDMLGAADPRLLAGLAGATGTGLYGARL